LFKGDAFMNHIYKLPVEVNVDTIRNINQEWIFLFNNNHYYCDSITFDFSDVNFIRPSGLAVVAALMKYVKNRNCYAEYYLKEAINKNVCSYMERMDFYSQFKIIKDTINRQENSGLCELKEVIDANTAYIVVSQLSDVIKSQINISDGTLNAITHTLGEIIDNIFHHSNSPINGIVCAQTYRHAIEVEIAIADCGIGVYESLKNTPNYNYIVNDAEALKLCVGKKITSKPFTNAGEGLFVAKRIITQNQGKMNIISGSSMYKISNIEDDIIKYPYWQGTIVNMVFNLDVPVNIKDIFDSEFPEDAVHDDFDEVFD